MQHANANIHYEEILIATALQDTEQYYTAKNLGIVPLDFQNPLYQRIWENMDKLATQEGITPFTISSKLAPDHAEQRDLYINQLTQLSAREIPISDIEYSRKQMRNYNGLRALRELSNSINISISDGVNVDDIVAKATSDLFSINSDSENIKQYNAFEAMNETSKEMKKRMSGEVSDGVKTGISTLDKEINCYYYGLATIIIGRPGHGKTTLMINTYVNNLKAGDVPVFVSLEMPTVHVVIKMLAIWTKIKINKLFNPTLLSPEEKEIVRKALIELSQKEFYIVDAVSMTVTELGMILLKYVKLGCKVAYVDYIQLIKLANGQIPNTAAEFRTVFKEVRELLRQVNRYGEMACVLGAQAGRSTESRPIEDRIPQMNDLEWSSSLEQDAAVIIGIMNREKYEGEDCEYKNQVFLGFPKHRYENAVRVNLAFIGNIQLMADLASPDRYERKFSPEEISAAERKRKEEEDAQTQA